MDFIVGTERREIHGMTIAQVVELAMKEGAPPTATILVHEGYDGHEAVLEWPITRPLETR